MLDFLRDLTKSAEEKRQEQITAYVDGALSPAERRQFETQLNSDSALRAEVKQLQRLKQSLRQLPERRVPRNFTLDPAVYGKPAPQPLFRLVPTMRVATVLTAVFLVIAVTADLLTFGAPMGSVADMAAEPVAMQSDIAATEEVDLTAEQSVEESAADAAMETMAMAEEAPADDGEMAEAEMAEEETAAEEELAEESVEAALIEATVMAPIAESMAGEEMAAEDGSTDSADEAADTPRIQPTPTLGDRVTEGDTVEIPPAEVPETIEQEGGAETAVESATEVSEVVEAPGRAPLTPLRVAQVGLAVLLLLFGGLWLAGRRQP